MAEYRLPLRKELEELLLVAAGAVPGALLRWQLAAQLQDRNVLVNTLGAAILGFLAGFPAALGVSCFLALASVDPSLLSAAGCWRRCEISVVGHGVPRLA